MAERTAPSTEPARGTVERVEPTKLQRAAARRAAESKATAPHLYLDAEVRVDAGEDASLVRATALALREFPRLNGAYRDGAFELYSRVNIGVAMPAVEALAVPTVFDADRKDVAAIAAELSELANRARSGTLTSRDLAGGTFTIALAAIGAIRAYWPILTQGQAGTLAVGPATERALVHDGTVATGRALTATLACDARMIGAEEGAAFLDRVRTLLEDPAALA